MTMLPKPVSQNSFDRFGEHCRAVTKNDANQPVARHFDSANHSLWNMHIRALVPVSGSNDSRKSGNTSHLQTWNTPPPWYQQAIFLNLALKITVSSHLPLLSHIIIFYPRAIFFPFAL